MLDWDELTEDDYCDSCGEPLDDAGDGYDGLCPTCADVASELEERMDGMERDLYDDA